MWLRLSWQQAGPGHLALAFSGIQVLQQTPIDISALLEDNCRLLGQLEQLLLALEDTLYVDNESELFDSPVGVHVRHILDHYDCLLRGLPDRRIDYDDRAREPHIESQTESACQRLRDVREKLLGAGNGDRELVVLQSSSDKPAAACMALGSSLARELVFLHSHTVHHQASIAALLRLLGVSYLAPPNFGLAPATAQHQEIARCAR